MKKTNISIVMAEYNTRAEDLDAAILSILNQTFKDFELIIVDDCGVNDVSSFVEKYRDSRIVVIKNDKNVGFALSLNNGIMHAKGTYIARMDTDDISYPERIERIYSYIINHQEYDVVGTSAVEFSGKEEYGTIGRPGEKDKNSIISGDIIIHASAIMKKSCLEQIGLYKDYRRAQDYVLWCDLLLNGFRLYAVDEVLYRYRVNPVDYSKRNLKNRKYEIKARLKYFPKLNASIFDYRYIIKLIIAGILPHKIVAIYRQRFVLNNKVHK